MDRFGRRAAQFVVGVRGEDDFPVGPVPGDLLAHLLQAPERIELEPFVVFVDRIVHGLLHFRPRHVAREVVGVGGDLRTRGIEIGHRLDRLIVAVEIGRRGQPSVGLDAQHLALASGALALHPVVRRATQRIGRREAVRIVLRQPIVIVVIGDAQVSALCRRRRIALVRISVHGRSPFFVEHGCRVQRRLMRFESAARDDTRKHGTIHPVVLGERPLVSRPLLAALGHGQTSPQIVQRVYAVRTGVPLAHGLSLVVVFSVVAELMQLRRRVDRSVGQRLVLGRRQDVALLPQIVIDVVGHATVALRYPHLFGDHLSLRVRVLVAFLTLGLFGLRGVVFGASTRLTVSRSAA